MNRAIDESAEPGEEFEATVVDVREERRQAARARWQLLLDQTCFATGREGSLVAISRGGARLCLRVLAVERDAAGQLWHVVEKPLAAGTMVRGRCEALPGR